MRRHMQSSGSTMPAAHSATAGSRWLVTAVSLCGALAGASIIEALAALASRSSAPISPDHVIAAPLALAGAICGGLLAAVLVSKEHHAASDSPEAPAHMQLVTDTAPADPMTWHPAALMIPAVRMSPTLSLRTSRAVPRARRVRRALRHHGMTRHSAHAALPHQTLPR
jgi:hypothetical protein